MLDSSPAKLEEVVNPPATLPIHLRWCQEAGLSLGNWVNSGEFVLMWVGPRAIALASSSVALSLSLISATAMSVVVTLSTPLAPSVMAPAVHWVCPHLE